MYSAGIKRRLGRVETLRDVVECGSGECDKRPILRVATQGRPKAKRDRRCALLPRSGKDQAGPEGARLEHTLIVLDLTEPANDRRASDLNPPR